MTAKPSKKPSDVVSERNKGGRPRVLVLDENTLKQIGAMAQVSCTQAEAAGVLHVSDRTFEKFLAENPEARAVWDDGHRAGKMSLRRKLFKLADTNAAAAIFLSKNLLGMKDGPTVVELDLTTMTDEQVALLATALNTARGQAPASAQGAGGDRAPPTVN